MTEILKLIFRLFFKQIETLPAKSELPYKHLIKSETAERLGIDNTPNDEQIKNLQQLNIKIYMPIELSCRKDGKELILNSGFRSEALNKAVGGAPNSDHKNGLACDLVCGTPEELFNRIKGLNLPYKQLIKEPTWVHVSLDLNDIPRKQDLEAYAENDVMKYRSI